EHPARLLDVVDAPRDLEALLDAEPDDELAARRDGSERRRDEELIVEVDVGRAREERRRKRILERRDPDRLPALPRHGDERERHGGAPREERDAVRPPVGRDVDERLRYVAIGERSARLLDRRRLAREREPLR